MGGRPGHRLLRPGLLRSGLLSSDLPRSPAIPGVRLTIAYDGTDFSGWARQPSTRTVQGTVEAALAVMNGAPVELRAASRTDAGVHAQGQLASFDPAREIPPRGWLQGVNAELPDDVAIVDATSCAHGYNPRFDTVEKTYRYLVLHSEVRDPLLRLRAWFVRPRRRTPRFDLEPMRAAAACLVGEHDFHAFRASDDDRDVTIRTMRRIDVIEGYGGDPRLIAIEVTGNAFLKNMVRILAGTLVQAARGRMSPDQIRVLLSPEGRREDAGTTAPAHGLTLVSIRIGRSSTANP